MTQEPMAVIKITHKQMIDSGEFIQCPDALVMAHGVKYPVIFTKSAWETPGFVAALPKIKSICNSYKNPNQLFLRAGRMMECGPANKTYMVHFGMTIEDDGIESSRIVTVFSRGEE